MFPQLNRQLPVAVRGEGIYLYDSEGKEYLNGCSGALVSNLGHGRRDIAAVMAEQAETLEFTYRTQFANMAVEALAARVAQWAPGDLDYSFFCNSGSEANEIAFRMVQQYWRERGKPAKRWMISRHVSYHGSTMGALSLTGNALRRRALSSFLESFPAVMAPHCYQCPAGKSFPACGLHCAHDLERAIQRMGSENVAAFVAEPMIGASGGGITPPEGYYEVIREICDQHDVLFIADEVMTGFGRTGRPFGIDHWSVVPDLLVVGKGISAGYLPLAGVVVREEIHRAFREGSGGFASGHTFCNNPLAARVGLKVLEVLEEEQLVSRAAEMGGLLAAGMRELARRYPHVGDVRGRGLMLGFELVRDRERREPFAFAANAAGRLVDACMEAGLMLYPCRGMMDGTAGDAVLVAPPLVIDQAGITDLLDRLDRGMRRWEEGLDRA